MSGHSKWHTIKHKKGAADAKRGKAFTRIIKELTVAARSGGGDPAMNPRLRTIIADAKANNMPRENIERAIRRGTGEEPGVSYEEIMYEGYGPGGVALLIQSLTDNKNRTVGEIRFMLGKYNGNLAAENSVAWMFSRKGQVIVEKAASEQAGADEEKLLNAALEAGADDMNDDGSVWEIVSPPERFEAVRDAVKALGVEPAGAEVAMLPKNFVKLQGKEAQQMLKLFEAIDDHDDVQHVWANFDIEEKEIEASMA
jgi:YebC/PmpR family DNA-binding regulatory protein